MPIRNWFDCINTNDYTNVLKKKRECSEDEVKQCEVMFSRIHEQYLDSFGIPSQLIDILALKRQILILKIDIELTGDKSINTFVLAKEAELAELTKDKDSKVSSNKIEIEKFLKIRISEKDLSVYDYYDYLNHIKESYGRSTD